MTTTIKHFFILLIFSFSYSALSAQHRKIDSLNVLIKKDIEDTNKVNHLIEASDEYTKIGSLDSTHHYCNAAMKLAQALDFKKGIADSYRKIGNVYNIRGNFPEALKSYFASLKIKEEIGDKQGMAKSYINIGTVYANLGNYTEALNNYFAALKIFETIGNKQGIANSYNNIGNVNNSQANYKEALKNYFASLQIRLDIGDKQGIAMSYNNIGDVYTKQKNLSEALENYFASLKIRLAIGDKNGIAMSYNNIGDTYRKDKQFRDAEEYLQKATVLSIEIGDKDEMKECEESLSKLDSATGNFQQAYEHYKLYTLYKDSLDNEESRKKIIQQSMTYEFEKKEAADKADQDKKEAVMQAEDRKQRIIIWLVAAGLLLVSMFMFNNYKQRQSKRKVLTTVIETEEKERKRIAEDLHDGLGPLLSSVSLYVNELQSEKHGQDKKKEFFKTANDLIDESIRNTRMIANNLMPGVLNDYGLINALETFCNKLKKTGAIEVSVHTELKDKRYNTVVEITLYRVILELINNTLKHAAAASVDIEIHEKDKFINIFYSDNGKGFDVEKTMNDPQKGLGLNNIVNRIKTIGGKCDFQSVMGKGIRVNIEVNYKKFTA